MTEKDAPQGKSDVALREEEVLKFWAENKIFEKSLEQTKGGKEFIFYEGPPTANAKPALHHLEARAFKDAIPRYKTMQGYHVRRKAGWDTHGLPVELQIEKELGFTGKPDIEKFGIEAFNEKCRESVYRYIGEWEKFTDRIGYWVDKDDAYYTFDTSYIESLWNIVAKIHTDGRIYKDYKVVPWCSRCGTALSSHELAQGYKDVKDLSVTVKFELVDQPGYYVLAWTTTPWTLPGNVGLAVGAHIDYVTIRKDDVRYILAKDRLSTIQGEYVLENEFKGVSLAGRTYKPLYPYLASLIGGEEKKKLENAYKIYTADFVTTTDGTGIVHTAVMYGQDDFELGTKVGLPKIHLVKPDGTFVEGTGFLAGRFVKEQDENGKPTLAVDIIDDLKKRSLFFSQENITHTYPFCWRCSTPLVYYARDSWYIRMSDLRPELVKENQGINWEPAHIRDGRMGEWLAGDKDWAISRERYWGTPLPIWQSDDGTERVVIGSVADLRKRIKTNGNTYFTMRHGEADHNVSGVISQNKNDPYHLTEKGKADVLKNAEWLKNKNIDVVVVSPFIRTQETARIVLEVLGLPESVMVTDERIGDVETGHAFHTIQEYEEKFHKTSETFEIAPPGGKSLGDVKRYMGAFLYELESKYKGKNILIISHGDPLWMLHAAAQGLSKDDSFNLGADHYPEKGVPVPLPFVPLPHNKNFELDLHKPYIDQVTLLGDSGAELKRTFEVMDVWFDSGSMPFAQAHYPFEGGDLAYPADFISEAIDQTRGWFYTLLAVGVLMGRGTPYKNVICLGHLLDEKGAKMSKSKGNVVEPFSAMDEHGADLLRYWMYSVNAPGEGKNFDPKVLSEVKNKVFNPFLNAVQFYEMYGGAPDEVQSTNILDCWMSARLNLCVANTTKALDAYDMYTATREIRELIGDLSQWYVRRSRDRFKDENDDARMAASTLRATLITIAKLLAPFAPFVAEHVYQKLRGPSDPESVHLASWPDVREADMALVKEMELVRHFASHALQARQKAGIKVRQPLSVLRIMNESLAKREELLAILADEVNVKTVVTDTTISKEGEQVALDTTLTPELIEEGELRDLIREVQDLRKTNGLMPKDKAILSVGERGALVEKHWEQIAKATGLSGKTEGDFNVTKA